MRKKWIKGIAIFCSITMFAGSFSGMFPLKAQAGASDYLEQANVFLDAGGYKTEPFGTVTSDYMNTYQERKDVLPKLSDVYLTDNYKSLVATVPTSDWASSVVFDQYSESLYVHPMAFRATSMGMEMATPAVVDVIYHSDNEPAVESLLEDSSVELVMGGNGFTAKDASVDSASDWTYDILMANTAGSSSILTTLAKGSPYVYYQFTNVTPTLSLGGGATNMTIYKNNVNSNSIGVSVLNTTDNTTHYYGVYASSGATWTNAGNKLTANLPSGKEWITIAALPDGSDETFTLYETYAANRISDTKVEWEYNENESKVYTTYHVTTTNMDTGVAGGNTIIALYPHQWRYAQDVTYTGKVYKTIRGTMKTTIGNQYATAMTYNGILTAMPTPVSEEGLGTLKNQISYFWDYYQNTCSGTYTEHGDWQYGGYDTYWMGKNFNKRADIVFMAEQIQDDSEDWATIKGDVLTALKNDLQYWFNPADCYTVDANPYITGFFYYYDDFGTLIGYNSSYSSDSELNDHHFHYGYWIKAAAAVATYVDDWEKEWGAIVYEMISDMANPNRDGTNLNVQRTDVEINSTTNYPFLRNFDIYEGHSWASGVANYEYDKDGNLIDPLGGLAGGNNQESTSEAINAWSSLILWGEAVGDERIRDLGVYLYTTELAAIEEYYFDMYDEVFTDAYEDKGADGFKQNVVTRLFGGRYDHSAWWTEDPIEVTSIHMIPMTGSTLYFSKFPQKITDTYDSIFGKQWDNYIALKNANGWSTLDSRYTHHDLLAEFYALADPETAMGKWSINDVGGQTIIEAGESRAHTYGYIQSMIEFGTPNYNVTGSSVYSMVFEKEDGTRTYVAQNYSNAEENVYFSDGTYITVPANSAYAGAKTGDGENPNLTAKVNYTVETYLENVAGTGYDMQSVTKKAAAGEVSYEPESITGFTFDASAAGNVLSGTLEEGADNTVTLKVYYKRNHYTIQYELNEGTNAAANPSEYIYGKAVTLQEPARDGYRFAGWYTDSTLQTSFTGITESINGNLILYAKWISETSAMYQVTVYFQNTARTGYEQVEQKVLEGEIGQTVNAVYSGDTTGFTLNSESSVASGVVAAGDSLALSLYYDRNVYQITYHNMDGATQGYGSASSYVYGVGVMLLAPSKEGYNFVGWYTDVDCTAGNEITQIQATDIGDKAVYAKWTEKSEESDSGVNTNPNTDNGFTYDASNGKATFFYDGIASGIVYIATFDTLEAAESAATQANANKPGFEYVTGQAGYTLTVNGSRVEYEYTVAEGKYLVYAFNPNNSGVGDWYIGQAGGTAKASYTVNHLKQNVSLSGYELADQSVIANQNVGATVNATANTYEGFTYDTVHSVTSGEVQSDNSLILNLYYTRNKYTIQYENMDGATNAAINAAEYVYGVGLSLAEPTKTGYTFGGWYTDAGLTESSKVTAISTTQTGEVILYAKWTQTTTGGGGDDGTGDGKDDGTGDGKDDGTGDGIDDGTGDGIDDGTGDGKDDGTGDGKDDGTGDGKDDGTGDGKDDGTGDGKDDGTGDGKEEGIDDKPIWSIDEINDQYYTGKKITPTVVVKYNGKKLQKNKDYTIKYQNNLNAGTATVVVTGKGNYTGTKYITFEILPIDLGSDETVTADGIYKFVSGKAIKMSPVVKWGNKKLKINKDFLIDTTVEGSQLTYTDEGQYELVLKGMGNYTGKVSVEVVLADKASTTLISKAKVNKISDIAYEGSKEYCPLVTVSYKGAILTEGTHYEVEYRNNKNAGTAQVVIKGLMKDENLKFTGTKIVKFKIKGEKLTSKGVSLEQKSYTYSGERIKPVVTVTDKYGKTVSDGNYSVSYSNNIEKGTGKVTVTGKNGYEGSVTKTFAIRALDVASDSVLKEIEGTAVFAKGGAKTKVVVTYEDEVLTENVDYTLSYSNNRSLGMASVTINGKGNFGGKYTETFSVEEADIENLLMTASDVVYNSGKDMKYYLSKPALTDTDGKKLSAGKDYTKEPVYEICQNDDEWTVITKDSPTSQIAIGTKLRVTVQGMGNYSKQSSQTVEYRVIAPDKSIQSAKVTILPQIYNGGEVTIDKEDIVSVKVKINGTEITLDSENYEIVEGSYKNNTKKGNASVMLRGAGEYGGYKSAVFKIESKDIEDTSYVSRLFRWLKSIW